MNDTLTPNLPNAAKLIYSLRHLDYNNITALTDIIDNSIDANASQVWVDISPKKTKEKGESDVGRIIISDNGCGMTMEDLDQALKLGSETDRNPTCDLGLYGMGLVTASISMGTCLEVITKAFHGEYLKSVQDLDSIYEQNDFVKILGLADDAAKEMFDIQVIEKQKKSFMSEEEQLAIKNTGTVVIIDNIDNCQWKRISGLTENLISHLGQVYRKFLQAEKVKLYVQGQEVKAKDPIYDYEPTILFEDEVKLEDGSIKITIARLKNYGTSISKEKGINIQNQGFYVLRNNREILAGETFGIFSKHNDFNTLRIEFSYPGTLDNILSSNFSKNKVVLNQSIKNKVSEICNPFIKQVRQCAKEQQRSDKTTKEDFSSVEKYITQKSHLLKTPPAEIEERSPKTKTDEIKVNKDIEKHGPRLNIQKRKRIDLNSLKIRFDHKTLGEKGPLYDVDREREKVVIYWNDDHPFYQYFIEANAGNNDVFNPICFLIYCLGSAELIAKPDSDSYEIIENIRYDVGRNLAVLLK